MAGNPFDRRPSEGVRAAINHRAEDFIRTTVDSVFEAELRRWAREDDCAFPDRVAIRARVERELLVLCSGLGAWAAAAPAEIFAHVDRDIQRAEQLGQWEWGE